MKKVWVKILFFCAFVLSESTGQPQILVLSDTGVKFISSADSADVEKINFLGKKNSLKYVSAILDEGKKIKVPVVNDLIPTLELHMFDDGSYLRVYHYDRLNKYHGETLLKFKVVNGKSKFFDVTPSLESEKVSFQEAIPATGIFEPK